VQQLSDKDP